MIFISQWPLCGITVLYHHSLFLYGAVNDFTTRDGAKGPAAATAMPKCLLLLFLVFFSLYDMISNLFY